jgi:GDP-L-fucose synthase
MTTPQKIYVAGHRGMVGSAIVRQLHQSGISSESLVLKTHAELDLTNQAAVQAFFEAEKPDQVYLAAAKVGGIHANNTYPAEFIYENLIIEANVIHQAWRVGVQKLLFLGSSCIYPKLGPQPLTEEALLTGPLEPTNEPYAIAKIAGIKLCESYNRQFGASHGIDYRSIMPTNLYGPGDNYHPENSHVIPALIRRFHEAKVNNAPTVTIWGTGTPRREFLYVDDMAAASVHVMNLPKATFEAHTQPMQSHINVGYGQDITIAQLAQAVRQAVAYEGQIDFDPRKSDGTPRKVMDSGRLNALGWRAKVGLVAGLTAAYQDFMSQLLAEESSFLNSQTVTSILSSRAQWGNPSPSPTQP